MCVVGLCSCYYTNYNQQCFKGKREYVAWHLDYHTDEKAGIHGLPPVLYSYHDDWYVAAIRCELKEDYPYGGVQDIRDGFLTRHDFEIKHQGVYYHKITPELAARLLYSDQESLEWFKPGKVAEEIKKAGGEWLPKPPPGAKAMPARFLEYCRRRVLYVEPPVTHARWYTYPAAGATLLFVDVPATTVLVAVSPLTVSYEMLMQAGMSQSGGAAYVEDDAPIPTQAVKRGSRSHHKSSSHDRHHHSGGGHHEGRKHHHSRGGDHHHSGGGDHHHSGRGDHHRRHHSDDDDSGSGSEHRRHSRRSAD